MNAIGVNPHPPTGSIVFSTCEAGDELCVSSLISSYLSTHTDLELLQDGGQTAGLGESPFNYFLQARPDVVSLCAALHLEPYF